MVAGKADVASQLRHIIQEGEKTLEAKRWNIMSGSREIILPDQFDPLAKVVILIRNDATATAGPDPLRAGLPLAGLCVLIHFWARFWSTRVISDTDQNIRW